MNVSSGCNVVFNFDLDVGNQDVTADSISARLSGPMGVIADWNVIAIEFDNESYSITIDSDYNTLDAGVGREARILEINVEGGNSGGIQRLTQEYLVVQNADELVVMTNTFQNYAQAVANASMIPNTPGWDNADADMRIVALMSAYDEISRMNFTVRHDGYTYRSRAGWGLVNYGVGSLREYSLTEFNTLDADFRRKLCLGQVAEADTLLTDDPEKGMRDLGVVSEKIGENSTTFRVGKPLKLSIDRRTLLMLSPYVEFTARMRRR